MFNRNFCRRPDSNHRSLELEASALPTEPQTSAQYGLCLCRVLSYGLLLCYAGCWTVVDLIYCMLSYRLLLLYAGCWTLVDLKCCMLSYRRLLLYAGCWTLVDLIYCMLSYRLLLLYAGCWTLVDLKCWLLNLKLAVTKRWPTVLSTKIQRSPVWPDD